jgi:hypothetical protein
MTLCPRCHQPLTRTTAYVPSLTVLACRAVCRKFAVERDGKAVRWIDGGPELERRLVVMAESVKVETEAEVEATA